MSPTAVRIPSSLTARAYLHLSSGSRRAAGTIPVPSPRITIIARGFATSRASRAKNHIHTSVRRPEDLHTYQLLASTAQQPLLTLWTASWCPTCKTIAPLTQSLIESGIGEGEGNGNGVAFCEVELDAPDIMSGGGEVGGLGTTYAITSIPTLLTFHDSVAGPVVGSRVTDAAKLKDPAFLEEWIREQARRYNSGGGGGGGKSIFAGLFSGWK